jgi:hypothetical protein
MVHSDFWAAGRDHWYYLVGWPFTAHLLLLAAVAGWAALVSLRIGKRIAWSAGIVLALVLLVAMFLVGGDHRTTGPLVLACLSLPVLLLVEADRLSRRIAFTNIRVAASGGWLGRWNRSARLQDITDLDVRGRARGLDLGTLVAIQALEPGHERPHTVEFPGVRPARRARDLVRLLVQDATATPLLRDELQVDARLPVLLRSLR